MKGKRRESKKRRVGQKFISTYFRLQNFPSTSPLQAVPGLLLLLAFECRTRGLMTSVAVMSCAVHQGLLRRRGLLTTLTGGRGIFTDGNISFASKLISRINMTINYSDWSFIHYKSGVCAASAPYKYTYTVQAFVV